MRRTAVWLSALLSLVFFASARAEAFPLGSILQVARCNEFITLRETPAKKTKVLRDLPLGTKVLSMGQEEGEFTLVRVAGAEGWAYTQYLDSAEEPEGEEIALDTAAVIHMNLFLTVFTRQGMRAYWREDEAPEQTADFAFRHLALYEPGEAEQGEWPEGSLRVPVQEAEELCRRYLGKPFTLTPKSGYIRRGEWLYREGSDPIGSGGFAVTLGAEDLGEGRLRVRFSVYASGETWEPEGVCMMSEKQAARAYPHSTAGRGVAIVQTGGELQDRAGWTLERFAEE